MSPEFSPCLLMIGGSASPYFKTTVGWIIAHSGRSEIGSVGVIGAGVLEGTLGTEGTLGGDGPWFFGL